MDLSAREHRAVKRLLRVQRQWPWLRWVVVVVGLAMVGVGIHYQLEGIKGVRDYPPQMGVPVIAFQWAVLAGRSYLLFWLGFWIIGWVIGRWNGDARDTLLLRLLEEHQK